jgi:ketosteroid isomerase-like protein
MTSSPNPLSVLEGPLRQVLDNYKAAVYAKDVAAFLALYDDNVRVFDMWGAWSYDGIAAWRGAVAAWFDSLGVERVAVEFGQAQARTAPDLAVVHVFVLYRALGADGQELRSMTNRMTLALRQTAGQWRIVHEHTSSPVDHDTAKAIFEKAAW